VKNAVISHAKSDEGVVMTGNEYAAEVGARIAQARKELGLTQLELAELAGVSPRSMQGYEVGEVIPYRRMKELAAVLQKSTAWLLHGDAAAQEESTAEIVAHLAECLEELRAVHRKVDNLGKMIKGLPNV